MEASMFGLAVTLGVLLSRLAAAEDVLRPGDVIQVYWPEEACSCVDVQLDRAGYVVIPSVGRIKLAGASESEAASLTKGELEKKRVLPKATVRVKLLGPRKIQVIHLISNTDAEVISASMRAFFTK